MILVDVADVPSVPGCQRVHVAGEIDMWTIESLDDAMKALEGQVAAVVLDLGDVTFIDSTGIGAIVGYGRQLQASGSQLRVVSHHPAVDRVLHITGVGAVLSIDASLEDAVRGVTVNE